MAQSFDNGIQTTSPLNAYAVTPSDTVDLPHSALGIYVGVSGNLAVITYGGNTVTFIGLASGVVHPIAISRVLATGTTATGIVSVN